MEDPSSLRFGLVLSSYHDDEMHALNDNSAISLYTAGCDGLIVLLVLQVYLVKFPKKISLLRNNFAFRPTPGAANPYSRISGVGPHAAGINPE